MSDTALDREIQAALDVDPSSEFVARVRQRIEREPAPTPWWRRRELVVGAAGLLVAAGLWAVPRRTVTEVSSDLPSITRTAPPVVGIDPPVASPVPSVAEAPIVRRTPARTPEPPPVPEDDLPPVILAENERAALRMLGAATRIEPPEPAEITVSTERSASARPELASLSFDAPDMGRPVFEGPSLE
jgi:hypothetical protein